MRAAAGPDPGWRLCARRAEHGSRGGSRGHHALVVAGAAVTGSEARWNKADGGGWAGRGSDGRPRQPMARRAPPGGRGLAGAEARGGRAGFGAAPHWLGRAGGGPRGGRKGTALPLEGLPRSRRRHVGPPSRVLCAPGGTDGRRALEAAVGCGPRAAHARRGVTLQHPRCAVPPALTPCRPQCPPSPSFLGAS